VAFQSFVVLVSHPPTIVMKPDNNDGLKPQDRVDKMTSQDYEGLKCHTKKPKNLSRIKVISLVV
jgi:hypothetical protein